jgi:iron complex outermembrane receptor protein
MIPKSFEQEFVRSYEIGSKNELFDHKLRLNLSRFYGDYRNQQESSEDPLPFEGGNINIPKSHVYGLEAEMSWILPAGFRFNGNMTVMRSKIDSHVLALEPYQVRLINRLNGGPLVGNDLADRANALTDVYGNQLGRVPHFSAAAGINKTFDVAEAGTLDAFVQVNYRSAYWFRYFNDPAVDRVGKQFFMNLNLRFQPEAKPYYVSFEVTNLTASHDIAARYAEDFGVGGVFDFPVPPRQFIGRIGFNF